MAKKGAAGYSRKAVRPAKRFLKKWNFGKGTKGEEVYREWKKLPRKTRALQITSSAAVTALTLFALAYYGIPAAGKALASMKESATTYYGMTQLTGSQATRLGFLAALQGGIARASRPDRSTMWQRRDIPDFAMNDYAQGLRGRGTWAVGRNK